MVSVFGVVKCEGEGKIVLNALTSKDLDKDNIKNWCKVPCLGNNILCLLRDVITECSIAHVFVALLGIKYHVTDLN